MPQPVGAGGDHVNSRGVSGCRERDETPQTQLRNDEMNASGPNQGTWHFGGSICHGTFRHRHLSFLAAQYTPALR